MTMHQPLSSLLAHVVSKLHITQLLIVGTALEHVTCALAMLHTIRPEPAQAFIKWPEANKCGWLAACIAASESGGGVYLDGDAHATLQHCLFTGNTADYGAGGMLLLGASGRHKTTIAASTMCPRHFLLTRFSILTLA